MMANTKTEKTVVRPKNVAAKVEPKNVSTKAEPKKVATMEATKKTATRSKREMVSENKSNNIDIEEIIKDYETIPMKHSGGAEQKAIYDIKKLIDIMEKDVQGKLSEADRKIIKEYKKEWFKSVNILKEYFEGREV